MTENSKIEWTDHTFNPWIGCTKVSPACDNCYAERLGARMQVQWGAGMTRKLTSDSNWTQPLRWNRRCEREGIRERVFCASLADVFDNEVPDEWRLRLWNLIEATPHIDWLLLTKRIGNAPKMFPFNWIHKLPANIWLGISVVTQAEADRDIPKLVNINASTRFLSCEPLISRIDLANAFGMWWNSTMQCWEGTGQYINRDVWGNKRLHWVIAGGESGHRSRPMNAEWCDSLRRTSQAAGAGFFMKQGSAANWPDFKNFASFPKHLQLREAPR